MDSKAVISWLGVVARSTTSVPLTGVSAGGGAGQLLAPVPLTGVASTGHAGMLISKARVTWVGITPRNVREVSINGVSSRLSQGELTTPVPIHGVSTAARAGYLVSRARIAWINISASPDKSVGLSGVSTATVAGELQDPWGSLVPLMRVVYQNHVDQASLTASSSYAAYPVENLQNDTKSRVHRSTGVRVTYTLRWATDQLVGAVAMPATNLTANATIRVQLFSDEEGTVPVGDSGTKLACPTQSAGVYGLSSPTDASTFAFGGASKAAVWFKRQRATVRCCVIYVEDLLNPAGFIDCSRLVVGPYWQAEKNPVYGGQVAIQDQARVSRGGSGDLWAARGAQFETLAVDLEDLTEHSRAALLKILRSSTSHRNMYLSLLPDFENTLAARSLMSPEQTLGIAVSAGLYITDGYVEPGYVMNSPPGTLPTLTPEALRDARSMEQAHTVYGRLAAAPFSRASASGYSLHVDVQGW